MGNDKEAESKKPVLDTVLVKQIGALWVYFSKSERAFYFEVVDHGTSAIRVSKTELDELMNIFLEQSGKAEEELSFKAIRDNYGDIIKSDRKIACNKPGSSDFDFSGIEFVSSRCTPTIKVSKTELDKLKSIFEEYSRKADEDALLEVTSDSYGDIIQSDRKFVCKQCGNSGFHFDGFEIVCSDCGWQTIRNSG
ncbi:MAG: hypothetical protein WA610_05525 [Thermodesulfovibrionales bacterium]